MGFCNFVNAPENCFLCASMYLAENSQS